MSVRLYNICSHAYRLQTGNMLSDFFFIYSLRTE